MNSMPLDCVDDWRYSGVYRTHCIWAFAITWIVGVAALLCDYLQTSQLAIIEMRTLFALVCCMAVDRLLMPAYSLPRGEMYLFLRRVSRWVYIFTYLLAAVRVSLFLYETWLAAGTPTLLNRPIVVRPMDDFQFYVLCCLAPLWLLRIASQLRAQGD